MRRIQYVCLALFAVICLSLLPACDLFAAGVSNVRVTFSDQFGVRGVADADGDTTDNSFSIPSPFNPFPYEITAINPGQPIATASGSGTSASMKLTNIEIKNVSDYFDYSIRIVVEADWMHDAGTVSVSAAASGSVTTNSSEDVSIVSLGAGIPPVLKEEESLLEGFGTFDLGPVTTLTNVPAATETIEATMLVTLPPGGKMILPDSFDISFNIIPEPTTCGLALAALGLAMSRRRIAAR